MSTFDLEITKTIPATPRIVFDAWLDPTALAKFMLPMDGMTAEAKADAREGGEYLVVMKAGDQELPHHGIYKTIDKYSTLAFTWNNPFNETESLVTLHFAETDAGETTLTLRHTGLPSEESQGNHQGGWERITDTLKAVVSAAP
tara:strand:+ start:12774 stop:13205 length:432 start_codon:yes stop_codon:yes gene_type:complete